MEPTPINVTVPAGAGPAPFNKPNKTMTNPADVPVPAVPHYSQSPQERYVAVELRDADGLEIATGRAWIPNAPGTLTSYPTLRVAKGKAPENAVALIYLEEAAELSVSHGRECACSALGRHYHFQF